ncbi:MAG TPA: hypothetical protein VFV27_09295 [Nevskiaceae bacterium]|nr:hypothetical protein [Nevskiaceae bacterium]
MLGLAILVLALAAAVAWELHQLRSLLAAQAARRQAAEARGADLARRAAALDELISHQQLAEQALDSGAALVQEVHRGIADIPFSVLETVPGVAPAARVVRQLHDRISDDIYQSLRGLNRAVGRELRRGVERRDPEPRPEPDRSGDAT